MSLSDLASLGSFVSGVAVLISLVYLALQVRQAEKYQRAQITQARTTRGIEIHTNFSAPDFLEAAARARSGAVDLTEMELHLFNAHQNALFVHWEDTFYQHAEGLMSERSFMTAVNLMRASLSNAANRVLWRRSNSVFQTDFRRFIDALLADAPVSAVDPALLDQWKADVAAELASRRAG